MITSASTKRVFSGSSLTPPKDYAATIEKVGTGASEEYIVTEERGTIYIFYGFDSAIRVTKRGKLKEKTNRSLKAANTAGVVYNYNDAGMLRWVVTGAPQSKAIWYHYEHVGGEWQLSRVDVHDGSLATDPVMMKAEYTYYDEVPTPSTDLGSDGDLVQVKVSRLASDGTSWIERTTQYRYYNSSSTNGAEHQLKSVFKPDAVQRVIDGESSVADAADMLTEDDSTVNDYATRGFVYYTSNQSTGTGTSTEWGTEDLNSDYGGSEYSEYSLTYGYGAVKAETVGGCSSCGSSTAGVERKYYYLNQNGGSSTDPNEVVRIVIEDTIDAADNAAYRRVWGINFRGAAIREAFIEDPTETGSNLKAWCKSYILDSGNFNITEYRMPSAHGPKVSEADFLSEFFNPTGNSGANDTDTVSSTEGLVNYYEYDTDFGDGDHRTGSLVREGAGTGSRYYVSATDWGKGADDEPTFLPLARYIYPEQKTSRADSTRIKSEAYEYDFWDTDDTAIQQRITTLPVIPTSQNGSGVATKTYQYFDEEGRLRWAKDGEENVDYYSYHPNTGARSYTLLDVETDDLPVDVTSGSTFKWVAWDDGSGGTTVPANFINADDDNLQMAFKREFDSQGRVEKEIEPDGDEHLTKYYTNGVARFPYVSGTTAGLPVNVRLLDDSGKPTEQYTVKPSAFATNASSIPTSTSNMTSRMVYSYDSEDGQLQHVDRYFDADGTTQYDDYARTTYLYDDLGRRGAVIRDVKSGKWQADVTVFDSLSRTIKTLAEVVTTKPTSYSSVASYDQIHESEYDGGGIGDSHLTSHKKYYSSTGYTETKPQYTYRGHTRGVVLTDSGTEYGPYRVFDIDWLGSRTATASYATKPTTWPTDYTNHVASGTHLTVAIQATTIQSSTNTTIIDKFIER